MGFFTQISGRLNWRGAAARWKGLTIRKIIYFPRILDPFERWIMLGLLIISLSAGTLFLSRIWIGMTHASPKIGGFYREGALAQPRIINPLFAVRDIDRDLSRLMFSGLFTYDPHGVLALDLAEHYEISPDGKTYTVTLRDNLLWHDQEPLEADDVAFTVLLAQNALYKSPVRANWQGVKVEEIDRRTVRFILRSPYAPFIENLTLGIIPKHLWEEITPEQVPLHTLSLKPVGSGSYMFSSLVTAKDGELLSYTMQRTPFFHREGPYLRTIIFSFFTTEEELLQEWRRGRIDGFGPASVVAFDEAESRGALRHAISMPRAFGIFFNQKKTDPLAEHAVREAIARALDKNLLAREATLGNGEPLNSSFLFLSQDAQEGDEPQNAKIVFNPEESRALLERAGWKDEDGDGVREKTIKQDKKSISKRLEFTLTTSDWPDLARSAEMIKSMLGEIGIAITIEKKPFSELESAHIRPRNFQILLFGQVYGYEPDSFAFWHSSQVRDPGLNITNYANAKADKLLEEARMIADAAARAEKFAAFADILERDLPAIALFSQRYLYILPSDMQGVELKRISLPQDRFNAVHQWYRKTKRVWGKN